MKTTIGQRDRMVTLTFYGWTGEKDEGGGPIYEDIKHGPFWARMQPLKGSETVIAARLTGVQPFIVTIPWQPEIANVTNSWKLYDEDKREYSIKSAGNMDEKRQFIELLVERK